MIEIHGTYGEAIVYTQLLEPSAEKQIRTLCDRPQSENSRIRIMPDVHTGKGCVIGLTMTISDQVIPNLVGVDIGCGMLTVKLKEKRLNFPELDSVIHAHIPYGRNVRERPHRSCGQLDIRELCCFKEIDTRRALESLGSLGGGNHFIEVDTDGKSLYLVIHTGSRNPGLRVAEYYQKIAYHECGGRTQTGTPYELAYLTGSAMQEYLHDMEIMQKFADLNRTVIKEEILDRMHLTEESSFTTIHNYIDMEQMILRKGAVSAQEGERLLIPMNMRDGSLICTGLGNSDWNCSAPHGAGRRLSRQETMNSYTLQDFRKSMEGIYTSSVAKSTIDECPMAYKPLEEILENIRDTVRIDQIIKPVYNFKASDR